MGVAISANELLRRRNTSAILRHVLHNTPITRTELALKTGLSAQTITNITRQLIEDGLLQEANTYSNGNVGRNPTNLELRPDGALAISCNIERDRLILAVVNFVGEIVHLEVDEGPLGAPDAVIARIIDYATKVLSSDPFLPLRHRFMGVGIGAPGPIDYHQGLVVGPSSLPEWNHVPLRDRVRDALGMPVQFDNSATVAAVGERWRGRWEREPFLYCHWGLGIGAGLLVGDDVFRGVTGNALEFGHMMVEPHGIACECGSFGCMEAYSSIPAILKQARAFGSYESIVDLMTDAAPNTPQRSLLERAGTYFAQALVSTVNILDVSMVLIGGHTFHDVAPIFLPIIHDYLATRVLKRAVGEVKIRVTDMGEEVGAIGAACLVFNQLLLEQGGERIVIA